MTNSWSSRPYMAYVGQSSGAEADQTGPAAMPSALKPGLGQPPPVKQPADNMPQLGATFVPGGFDDYYMPEVIAPAPQRVMPEVPQNMQEDLQRMELEAHEAAPRRESTQEDKSFKPFPIQKTGSVLSAMDAPSFSPFPKIKGENIPPSDDEKEGILWQARALVLHSNNVSMQVTWARDTLSWVEVAQDAQAREWKRTGKGRDRPATPKTEHELRVDAVNILSYLSDQDHPEATFMKGKWLEFGKFGFREDKREAYAYYKKAARFGNGRAEYRMGMLYELSNDIPNAIKHYLLGTEKNDSASNYRLGMMHLMGQHGHQRDFLQGLELIQKAADTADEDAPQGAYVYGMLIARELPDITIPETLLPCELSVARQYIEKAAYLGFSKAQLKMGQAYELSQLGCDFNPAYSLHYYGLAARQGQPEAALGVSRWFLFGFEDVFPKNEALAFKYAQEAAETGLATGEFAMGYYYEIGIHVPKDVREARRWYELAAEHGNSDAKQRIDSLSQSKTLTKQDHETTTLTRIKSQHGSQRGKRPDRFNKPAAILPTLSESTPVEDSIDFPDPERPHTMIAARPPAFQLNIDQNLPMRPKSAAPYPLGDRPEALNLRPKSVAPYPEDDTPPLRPSSQHYNSAAARLSSGPHADRPGSAFGIRPLSSNSGPPPGQPGPERGTYPPNPPQGAGWQPQVPPGYRQPSTGPPPRQDYRNEAPQWQQPQHNLPSQRVGAAPVGPGVTVPAGAAPVGDPNRNRLQKYNPHVTNPPPGPQKPQGPPYGQQPPAAGYAAQPNLAPGPGGQPGRDYGPRINTRPASDTYDRYDRYGAGPPPAGRLSGSVSNGNPQPSRVDSYSPAHGRLPSTGSMPLKTRPGQLESMSGGRSSAPPAQGGRPYSAVSQGPPSGPATPATPATPAPSVASTTKLPGHGGPARPGAKPHVPTNHPDGKTMGQGPATFEEMGIPQGKHEGDCVVM
ncbi:hypothetical protein B0H63DRAFT_471704 [Podospora didyma]|uniref:Chitin synthase regulatory factor n=1 Tax=Podospora didyma TaxID=330526 RepID=A0AAE0NNJ9_9PEZI|nr:hypothetical protein B0H63DRAFT_471704 [Podospora didyma]